MYRAVDVVFIELQMSAGKTAAQVAHGAVQLYMQLKEDANVKQWWDEG